MSLSKQLLTIGGKDIFGDQIQYDPDCDLILEQGKIFSGKKAFIEMLPNACHWNVSHLFENGVIDKIVIGYALSKEGAWFQHTWGIKDSTIIETSEVNFLNIETYFGVVMEDPKVFVELCNNNPKGSGKVRRVYTPLVEN